MARFRTCVAVFTLFVAIPCIAGGRGGIHRRAPSGRRERRGAEEDEDDLDDIESLVVTARRRPEFLQETPVAATVLGGELLEQRGIDSLEDIGAYVPNLSSFSGAQHQGTYYSRGVGQRDAIVTLDPGVGIYVDDVYIARGQGALLPTAGSGADRGAARAPGHALRQEHDRRRDQAGLGEAGSRPRTSRARSAAETTRRSTAARR